MLNLSRMSATLFFTIWCWVCPLFCSRPPLTLSLSGAITSHFLIHRLVVVGKAGNGGYAAARTLRCTFNSPLTLVHQSFIYIKMFKHVKTGKTQKSHKGQAYSQLLCTTTTAT